VPGGSGLEPTSAGAAAAVAMGYAMERGAAVARRCARRRGLRIPVSMRRRDAARGADP
jgi:hypothetical protein